MDAAAVGTAVYDLLAGKGYQGTDNGAGTVVIYSDLSITTTITDAGASVTDMTVNGTATGTADTSVLGAGAAVGTVSDVDDHVNIINGGSGDDVIVLSSEAGAAWADTVGDAVVDPSVDYDAVVLTGYSQGTDTIIHFESGVDKLDLSYYLTNTDSDSDSEDSQVQFDSPITADAGANFTANSVSVVNFTDAASDFYALLDTDADTAEFATLTAAEVEAALEDATSDFDTTVDSELYSTQDAKSILIIENNEQDHSSDAAPYDQYQNLGEYMIFEVTYENATVAANAADKDFTVKLIGTIDMESTGTLAATDVIS